VTRALPINVSLNELLDDVFRATVFMTPFSAAGLWTSTFDLSTGRTYQSRRLGVGISTDNDDKAACVVTARVVWSGCTIHDGKVFSSLPSTSNPNSARDSYNHRVVVDRQSSFHNKSNKRHWLVAPRTNELAWSCQSSAFSGVTTNSGPQATITASLGPMPPNSLKSKLGGLVSMVVFNGL